MNSRQTGLFFNLNSPLYACCMDLFRLKDVQKHPTKRKRMISIQRVLTTYDTTEISILYRPNGNEEDLPMRGECVEHRMTFLLFC